MSNELNGTLNYFRITYIVVAGPGWFIFFVRSSERSIDRSVSEPLSWCSALPSLRYAVGAVQEITLFNVVVEHRSIVRIDRKTGVGKATRQKRAAAPMANHQTEHQQALATSATRCPSLEPFCSTTRGLVSRVVISILSMLTPLTGWPGMGFFFRGGEGATPYRTGHRTWFRIIYWHWSGREGTLGKEFGRMVGMMVTARGRNVCFTF